MANATSIRVVRDGYRNAVVEIMGVFDTAAPALVVAPIVTLANFTSNDPGYHPLFAFRVDTIKYSISDSITCLLFWNATAQQLIAPIYGRGKLDFEPDGGLQPDQTQAGFDGALNLEIYNIAAAGGAKQGLTILLEMVKLYHS